MIIIITEANTKNSIALQRELSKNKSLLLIGFSIDYICVARIYKYCSHYFIGELGDAVKFFKPDLIIPVGSDSVKICSLHHRNISLLPNKESLEIAFNKDKMLILNELENVHYPKCTLVHSIDQLINYCKGKDCVIKSTNESLLKFDPFYISNGDVINSANFIKIRNLIDGGTKLLVQERVNGVGRGFFCLAKNGEIAIYYMHERIRELPITGGSSTAAKSIYCEQMYTISKEIIQYLKWTGPLMIEYKFDQLNMKYNLIELNPKFWGSLDLSYAVGFNFGQCLIDIYQNKFIKPTKNSYKVDVKYFWILDGDLVALFKRGEFLKIKEYFGKNAKNGLFESLIVDFLKFFWTLKKTVF
jgi:predicted ATP-grasp superfamily ATP-dependent carboligase